MRLLAVIVAALALSACGPKTTPPPATTTSATTTTAPPTAAPLDCANPANAAQRQVCADPHLSDLDHRLQAAYQEALARPGADQAALSAAQQTWATARDGCAQNPEPHTCLVEAYQTRLDQLAIADPGTLSPPVVTYQCPADTGPLTAQFYNEFDPPAAVLTWKGNPQILFQEPSGSGARYGRQGSEYWEHQGEVKLDLNGTKFVCRAP
ncbi:hypothetical protein A5681_10285 [Mycobacterium scrofulaceum]|uniref:lysozyme inhibitor LprI family protein n=1 Tax=Mycobacterium scrofulaceum TaxID=1783 RepID=UPI0007FF849F|nr:lysozyme inhibitor LprI family protein [Mycobacterium scrofulaceum]OBH75742.1 hypothetical protein A5681_10285 [Mycobacterium scrofulaceum]